MLDDVQDTSPNAAEVFDAQKPMDGKVTGIRRFMRKAALIGAASFGGIVAIGSTTKLESSTETNKPPSAVAKVAKDIGIFARYLIGDLRLSPQEQAMYNRIDAATKAGLNNPQLAPVTKEAPQANKDSELAVKL